MTAAQRIILSFARIKLFKLNYFYASLPILMDESDVSACSSLFVEGVTDRVLVRMQLED